MSAIGKHYQVIAFRGHRAANFIQSSLGIAGPVNYFAVNPDYARTVVRC